ncbi:MAG: hypothetical protein ACYTFA_14905 [Planctomycetota bacterium]|jgi:hypothetical protein
MEILLQAPKGLEGWINTIVILLIIGGSILGPVAKWLIAKTRRDAEEEPGKIGSGGQEAKPRPRVPPARPVARAMPVGDRQRETPEPPLATPSPTHRTARPAVPQEPTRPVTPPPPKVTPQRPAEQPPRPRPARPPARRAPAPAVRSERRVSPESKPRRPQRKEPSLHVTLGEEEDRKFAKRERELGTLRVQSELETSAVEAPGEFDAVRNPTRRSLRQAILMREILGPPLAMRPPDDRF